MACRVDGELEMYQNWQFESVQYTMATYMYLKRIISIITSRAVSIQTMYTQVAV